MSKAKPSPQSPKPPPPTADQIDTRVCDTIAKYCDRSSTWLYNNQGVRLGQGTGGVWLGMGPDYLNDVRLDLNAWIATFQRDGLAKGKIKKETTVKGTAGLVKQCF